MFVAHVVPFLCSRLLFERNVSENLFRTSELYSDPLLLKPADHSIQASRWHLGSPRSRECGAPLSPLSMSARTNAQRLWWRYKHSTPARSLCWRRWTHSG